MADKAKTSFIGNSDLGCLRNNNEDAFVAQNIWNDNTFLIVVIDGVGGYEGGEVAADIARRSIPDYLSASSNGERVELLKQAVTSANNAIFEARESNPEVGQMSCVLTSAIVDIDQRKISMAHVGDTRMYGFHNGILTKLSHDHSIIGYREEIGDLSEEEAMRHPQRNVISRDVGSQKHKVNDEEFIEAQEFPLMPNTTLLLCSDGLTDLVTTSQIIDILNNDDSLERKADFLINAALRAGGKDNVTVVLFDYQCEEDDDEYHVDTSIEEGKEIMTAMKLNNEPVGAKSVPYKKVWAIAVSSFVAGIIVCGLTICLYINSLLHKGACYPKTQQDTTVDIADTAIFNTVMPQLKIEYFQVQNDSLR